MSQLNKTMKSKQFSAAYTVYLLFFPLFGAALTLFVNQNILEKVSQATGFLLLNFGIANESPGDTPNTIYLPSRPLTLLHLIELCFWYTPAVTLATAFCLLQLQLTDGGERTEALQLGPIFPSNLC